MDLELYREPSGSDRTYGKLYIDGVYFCETLEDPEREEKVYGVTAIPRGRYLVTLEHSQCFGPNTITVHDVPDCDGVRIHGVNTVEDSHGCPLVGATRTVDGIARGTPVLDLLKRRVRNAIAYGLEVSLFIKGPAV
jgi:hypothetical protein